MPSYTTDRDQTPTKRIATSPGRTSRPARRLTPHAGLATTLKSTATRTTSTDQTVGQAHVTAAHSQERPSYENLAFNEVLTEELPPSSNLSLHKVFSTDAVAVGQSHIKELGRTSRSRFRSLMVIVICLASFLVSFGAAMRLDAGSWYDRAARALEQGALHARMAWYGQPDPHENVSQSAVAERRIGDVSAPNANSHLDANSRGQRHPVRAQHRSSTRHFRRRYSQHSSVKQVQSLVSDEEIAEPQQVASSEQVVKSQTQPWISDVDKSPTQSKHPSASSDKSASLQGEVTTTEPSTTINGVAVRARTEFGSWSVSGSLESSKVQGTVVAVRDGFAACYMAAARHAQRDSFGTLDVAFNVDTQGLVREINVAGSPLPGLDMCVKGLVRRLSFGQPANAGITHAFVKVTYSAP